REQVAALVVNAGEAVAHELLRDIGLGRAIALLNLVRGEYRPVTDLVEDEPRPVRNAAVEIAIAVAIIGAGRRVLDIPGYAGEFERLAVVIGGVAAAMAHHDWMDARYLVEIVDRQRAVVLHLGVVEKVAFDPGAGRGLTSTGAQLFDNALDGDELDLVRIA